MDPVYDRIAATRQRIALACPGERLAGPTLAYPRGVALYQNLLAREVR